MMGKVGAVLMMGGFGLMMLSGVAFAAGPKAGLAALGAAFAVTLLGATLGDWSEGRVIIG